MALPDRKYEKTSSGRLVQYRPIEKPKTDRLEKAKTEEIKPANQTPLANPVISDPVNFMKNMKLSWDRCEEMRKSGNFSQAEVGWAFYLALKELFGKFK